MDWLLRVAMPALLCITACSSTEDALAIMRCDRVLKPLVTQTFVQKAGPGAYACMRADAATKSEQALVRDHCAVGGASFEEVTYPARAQSDIPKKWWDLKDGDDVSYAALVTDGGAWESFAYRRQIGSTDVWLVCASWR